MFTINHILREVTFFVNVFLRKFVKKVIFRTISMNCSRKRENCQTFFGETSKNAISIVARGLSPAIVQVARKMAAAQNSRPFSFTTDAWRGTGPRPTVKGDGFLFLTVARGPVPRETLNRAEMVPFYRSAGACPPRASELHEKWPQPRTHGHFLSRSMPGEGQALALR